MRDFFRFSGLFVVGIITALIIYPFYHEMGHCLMAVVTGTKVVKVVALPTPYVVCDVLGVSKAGIAAIGLGGVFLPYLLTMLLKPKGFWFWYLNFMTRLISIWSLILSAIAIVFKNNSRIFENDDIVKVSKVINGDSVILTMLILLVAVGIILIIVDKPLLKITKYFLRRT